MQTSPALAAELAEWNDGRGISPLDWIAHTGSFKHFTAYARLIFPELVEVHGRLYLLDLFSPERLAELRKQCNAHRAQAFMNTIDLAALFVDANEQSDEDIRQFGSFLKDTWTVRVAASFPGRPVHIVLDDRLDEEGVGELLISLVDEA